MKSARIANALRGLMQARASGKLNIILNVTPQVLNLPHDKSVNAKVMKVSPTGEIILNTDEGEIRVLTSKKLQEGQDFKLSTTKNNGSVEVTLKSTTTGEEIHLKMPGDFKKMFSGEQTQAQLVNKPRYTKPISTPGYQTPNSQLPNTSLFSFLTMLDKKSVGAEFQNANAFEFLPDLSGGNFIAKIAKLLQSDSEFYQKFGDLEYVHNMRASSASLSTEAWKFFCIPIKFQEQVQQMKLIVEDQNNPDSDTFTGGRRFWIEINPEKLGRIQIDGVYTTTDGKTKTHLKLSSEKFMNDNLKMELSFAARSMHNAQNLDVELKFVDYNSRRDDAFQVLLENYCRNKVSTVYA